MVLTPQIQEALVVQEVQVVQVVMLRQLVKQLVAGDDRVQINVASSSSALSGMIDAAEGLDRLHLDGLSYSAIVQKI